ncbi:Stage III sporulation protein E [Slackia heliotrinireducens]|uniref:DNA segregation ATPase, FtsK/SpoIIIE family n=1 Tax=Slackia heliotrinireducens (strain ATCC 29202 / DSM 20476 / NCTC 11029 / RHS 1) TaxID=471855 RepID=C7N5B7_SLAHD|nr:DNA translocase FtsK 4TM domain-containing protein [Slackia heliotrinireducens]ACV22102.1 DNA segregation ATPase, FtsK/SpoIIIE family [Slackia heliotrinireducens DSM 20476]VEH00106.1 Stage III sporulation protein E [Slackia heliotrinireducens]
MARGSNSAAKSKSNASKSSRAKANGSAAKEPESRVPLKKAQKGSGAKASKASEQKVVATESPLLDERTKRDILGVVLGVFAVALLVTMVVKPQGIVTSFLANTIHVGLGVGAYILPIILIVVCVSLFVRTERRYFALRMAIGLFLILICIMSLFALYTSGGEADSILFAPENLATHGGYVGAGIAWVLLNLFGRAVGTVFLLGLGIGAAIIIGFSVSGVISLVQEKAEEQRQRRLDRKAEEYALYDNQPYDVEPDPVQHEPRIVQAPAPAENRVASGLRTRILGGGSGTAHSVSASAGAGAYADDYEYEEPASSAQTRTFVSPFSQVREVAGFSAKNNASPDVQRLPSTSHVPRDLSKPRRATMTLREQASAGLGDYGPGADNMDMYWPGEYAYEDAGYMDAVSDRDEGDPYGTAVNDSDAYSSANTQVLGAGAPPQSAAPTTYVPPEFTPATRTGQKAMTRRLNRISDEPAAPQPEQQEEPAATKKAPKTRALNKKPASKKKADTAAEVRDGFVLPSPDLVKSSGRAAKANDAELRSTAAELQTTLEDFGIMATVVDWVAGPTVTLFKVDLPSGVRVNRIMNLTNDIALALASPGVRIFAPVPGTNYVGIEVPNKTRQSVLLGDVLKHVKGGPLMVAIGKDVEGHPITADLAKMPHLLVAGTTGSGKSVAINSMIMTILMRATPDEVRLIMVDPKRVEFTPYNGIPHLYVPVVNDNKEAASALAWGVAEMERRLKVLSKHGVRNISQYNAKVDAGEIDEPDLTEDGAQVRKLPYIVIVIDELADLMMNVGKEVELSISRIAQLARAAGIHLILATQRPSTNVVTGLIKANITNRMALTVASGIDSRVILDETGAENLIGQGDMLYGKPEYPKPVRIQSCFVDEDEIEAVVEHLKTQGEPEYHNEILNVNVIGLGSSMPDGSGGSSTSLDPLIWEAADIVVSSGLGSTSNIQRRLSVGYSRAGRIMDMLEEKGIVGPPNGSKPREVLVDELELETLKSFELHDEQKGSIGF